MILHILMNGIYSRYSIDKTIHFLITLCVLYETEHAVGEYMYHKYKINVEIRNKHSKIQSQSFTLIAFSPILPIHTIFQ